MYVSNHGNLFFLTSLFTSLSDSAVYPVCLSICLAQLAIYVEYMHTHDLKNETNATQNGLLYVRSMHKMKNMHMVEEESIIISRQLYARKNILSSKDKLFNHTHFEHDGY